VSVLGGDAVRGRAVWNAYVEDAKMKLKQAQVRLTPRGARSLELDAALGKISTENSPNDLPVVDIKEAVSMSTSGQRRSGQR